MKINFNKIIFSVLSVLFGLVFIISALTKIPTLQQFGWSIVEFTPLHLTVAEWLARLLIGFELGLGILFVTHVGIKKIAIPAAFILLVLFTIYVGLLYHQYGPDGNCGCFGEYLPMTPKQSIIKNVVLLIILMIMHKLQYEWTVRYMQWGIVILFAVSVAVPMIVSPPESIYIYEKEPVLNSPIPLSLLYQSNHNLPPTIELRKGKHVIAFMSMTCQHCRNAAKRMRVMKKDHPELPLYMVLNGDSIKLKDFMLDTKSDNIDFCIFNGAQQFIALSGGQTFPKIRWVTDTTVYKESNFITLDEQDILTWLREH